MSLIDGAVTRFLSNQFKHESRRSFMSRITRGLFGIAGFSVGATAAPILMEALGQTIPNPPGSGVVEWQTCGLNGPTCKGPCAPLKLTGADPLRANGLPVNRNPNWYTDAPNLGSESQTWVMCCDKGYGKWVCCKYLDYCGIQGVGWRTLTEAQLLAQCGGKKWDSDSQTWCGTTRFYTPGMQASKIYPYEEFLCTEVACETIEHTSEAACKSNCKPGMPDPTGEAARLCHRNANPFVPK